MARATKLSTIKPAPMTPGQRNGRLVAIEPVSRDRHHNVRWRFQCDCGNEHVAQAGGVRFGSVQSCGCLHKERATTHGMSRTNEYKIWSKIITRCTNEKAKDFPRYGGRGINVCDRWRAFENFFADLGQRPSPAHSVDRHPNNDGNYEPDNCRWATPKEQARNRRGNHLVCLNGKIMTKAEALELIKIPIAGG